MAANRVPMPYEGAIAARAPLPFSDDFAVALGLKRSTFNDGRDRLNELAKMETIDNMITRVKQEHELQQDVIWSRFGALYLPATVDRFLDPPPLPAGYRSPPHGLPMEELFQLKNPYLDMIIQLQHLPYFAKYLRSQHPTAADGKRLTEALASRLVDLAPKLESTRMLKSSEAVKRESYQNIIGDVCQLLSSLLVAYSRDKDRVGLISQDTKRALSPYLSRWSTRYRGTFSGDTTGRTLLLLNENTPLLDAVQPMRKELKGLGQCGLMGCSVTTNLKACSRCVTVKYCSPEHQKMDWTFPIKAHKEFCHKTEY